MSLLENVLSTGEGGVVKQLAGQFGLNSDQTGSVLSALLPTLAGGLKERLGEGGASGLQDLISGGSLTKFADSPSLLSSPAALETGKSLVGKIFGSTDLTSMVSGVAQKAGVSSSIVTSILPIAATLLGSVLSKNTSGGGNLTDAVNSVASAGNTGILGTVKNLAEKVFG